MNEESRAEACALALVGMPGSGKTLCAQHLEARGFYQFRFGGIVTDEVQRRGQSITPENERVVREELRSKEGMDVMARRALPHLIKALETRSTIIIDGLYSFSEFTLLNKELPAQLIVVAIVAPRGVRYERLATRSDRPLTPKQAEERDILEIIKLEKGGPIAIADYTLVNDGDAQALLDKLDALLDKLNITP